MTDSVRKLVEEVLSPDMTREIWSGNYDKALPVSLHLFELSAILRPSSTCFVSGSGEVLVIF